MTWWRRLPEVVRDAVGGVPILLIFVFAQQIFGDGGSLRRAVVIVIVMGAALAVRRRWPFATFAAALSIVMVATTGLEFFVIGSYTLVAYRPRARPVVIACVSAVALAIGYLQYWPSLALEDIAGDLILIAGIAVLPPAIGRLVRQARQTTADLEERNAELLQLREKAAEHAVEAERFRIARELHDVVAHHVSAITVRARAGRHVAPRDSQAAADALAYIADAGTETLTAMGAFVGTLRGKETVPPGHLSPQPSAEDLPALLEAFRGTGLVVHAELDFDGDGVPSALSLNAYRIVQEALTNAIRHGAAERAWVCVCSTADELHIQVDDNGRGLPPDGHLAGHGLIGVAERASLHGGTSAIGPSPRGGCRLEAVLPVVTPRPAADVNGAMPGVRP